MAMADVLERPVAAPANRFPGGGAVRARRSAE
ncbi:RNA polymerase factor sigma-70, partial [Burkholderia multivorans]